MALIGADEHDAAGHGGRAEEIWPGRARRGIGIQRQGWDIRDPAHSVSWARTGIESMQLAITRTNVFGAVCPGLAPRPDDKHIVPRRAGLPVTVVAVLIVGERDSSRRELPTWRSRPAIGGIDRVA